MSIKVSLKRRTPKKENIGTQGQKKVFTEEQVKLIKTYLYCREDLKSLRDCALFSFALDTMLRSIDLLKLKVSDAVDGDGNLKEIIEVKQQKTGKITLVEITRTTAKSLAKWIEESEKHLEDFLWTGFTHNKKKNLSISRMQYGTIIKGWVNDILGIDSSEYNTHSMRRTKASMIYERTNNIEVVRQLLGHSSVAATSAYLNIGKRDALKVAKEVLAI
tara:strand:+ start:2697 stop:3350 length:654 start_codon:yes stop_codon:yes gene_type:complete